MNFQKLTFTMLLIVLLVPYVTAAGTAANVAITSQPTSLLANQNLAISFNVTDANNDWQNVTARLIVNSVNVVNQSWLNITTGPNGYNNVTSFNEGYYVEGDSIKVSFLVVDNGNATTAGNFSLTNTTNSTLLTVGHSSTSLLQSDMMQGLPSAGANIGDFLGNMVGGLFKFILLIGVAGALTGLFAALFIVIKNKGSNGIMKK